MVLKEKSQRFEPGLYICIFVKNSQMEGSLFATNRFNVIHLNLPLRSKFDLKVKVLNLQMSFNYKIFTPCFRT